MFRKICILFAVVAVLAVFTQQTPARARLGSFGQAPVVSDCPNCRLQQKQPIREVIQPLKEAVLPKARIEAIKYDAKLDGKEAEEVQPCPCEKEVKAVGPRKALLHGNRVRFRFRGRHAGC